MFAFDVPTSKGFKLLTLLEKNSLCFLSAELRLDFVGPTVGQPPDEHLLDNAHLALRKKGKVAHAFLNKSVSSNEFNLRWILWQVISADLEVGCSRVSTSVSVHFICWTCIVHYSAYKATWGVAWKACAWLCGL